MTAKKYNPGRVEVDPNYPWLSIDSRGAFFASFKRHSGVKDCAFAVAAINAAVDKLEKEEKPEVTDSNWLVIEKLNQISLIDIMLEAARENNLGHRVSAHMLDTFARAIRSHFASKAVGKPIEQSKPGPHRPRKGNMSKSENVLEEILAERIRQIEQEDWDEAHDDNAHDAGDLAMAASCYAEFAFSGKKTRPKKWPWASEWWKPKNSRCDLIRAAALIVAEIERGDRKAKRKPIEQSKPGDA